MIDPNLITTTRVGELPIAPLSGTSKIPHEVGTDLKQATIQELIDLITPLVNAIQFQVIELDVTQQYIIDNFDGTGLGINLMNGYAICNGNNGTINKDGRVGIAYGTNYNVVGAIGGSKDAAVVEHQHFMFVANDGGQTGVDINSGDYVARRGSSGGDNDYRLVKPTDASLPTVGLSKLVGVSGTNKNMQPYLVELQVMKL